MSTQLLAIDLSFARARVVVIEGSLRRSEVKEVFVVEREEGEEELAYLRRLREQLPEASDSLIVSSDPAQVSTRLLRFPFTDVRKVEQAIDFELDGQVPYDIDDVATAWHVVDRGADHTEVLCAVMQKERLAQRLEALEHSGLDARIMTHPAVALSELLPAREQQGTPMGVLYLGEEFTHLCVRHEDLQFVRTIRNGARAIERALAERFDLSEERARQLREQEARLVGPGESVDERTNEISKTIERALQPLISAVATTMKSLPEHRVPTKFFISGALSRIGGLCRFLATELGVSVALLDLRKALEPVVCDKKISPEFSTALGLGLLQTRRGRSVPLNLRRGTFAYSGDFQRYRGEIKRLGVGLTIVGILAIAGSIVRYSMVSAEERTIDRSFCEATKKIVGREICDPTAALATMRQTPGASDGISIPQFSAADLFETMSKAIPSQVDVAFRELDFRLEMAGAARITGKGEAASFDTIEQISASLKKDKCIREVDVSKQRKMRDSSRVEFNLNIQVECPVGYLPGSGLETVASASPTSSPEAKDTSGSPLKNTKKSNVARDHLQRLQEARMRNRVRAEGNRTQANDEAKQKSVAQPLRSATKRSPLNRIRPGMRSLSPGADDRLGVVPRLPGRLPGNRDDAAEEADR